MTARSSDSSPCASISRSPGEDEAPGPRAASRLSVLGTEVDEAIGTCGGSRTGSTRWRSSASASSKRCARPRRPHAALPVRIVDDAVGRQSSARPRARCTSAASRRSRTPPSTPGPGVSATVRLGATEATVCFAVADDGAGFDTGAADGTGLRNMHDRVAAMGGSLDVDSAPGRGTRLAARFPAT